MTRTGSRRQRAILQTLSEIKSTRVEDKLFEVARSNETSTCVARRFDYSGERASKRSFEFLSADAQEYGWKCGGAGAGGAAISERRAERSVPLLIKIARTHPNQMVRKQAIRSLGESGDPRAVDFFKGSTEQIEKAPKARNKKARGKR
jgi:hypothetical protein